MIQYHITALFLNRPLWIAAFACVTAQMLKGLIEYARIKKFNRKTFFSTGGMPSSHSALVVAMASSIAVTEGLYSPLFALALALAVITMHDAAGVRRAAGKQAEVINMLLESLHNIGIKPDKKLKELLGHSPLEVIAGAIWGLIVVGAAHGLLGV